MRTRFWGLCTLALAVALILPAPAGASAVVDIVLVVDESGSMSSEHAWIPGMLTSLNTKLGVAGQTANYALVGFGKSGTGSGRILQNVAAFPANPTAWASELVTSGSREDGYAAMDFAFTSLTLTAGAKLNVILITDEDRDNTNNALTYDSILADFSSRGALLNAVINNPFTCAGPAGATANVSALGVDSGLTGYRADGAGGYSTCANGVIGNGAGNTETAYAALALATGGAAWDLNQLRAGGQTAASFTAAFVDIKSQEITTQGDVPEPATMLLAGGALLGIALLRRRR